jgi:hypothetical protein
MKIMPGPFPIRFSLLQLFKLGTVNWEPAWEQDEKWTAKFCL